MPKRQPAQPLVEKYRPLRIDDFAGLTVPRAVLRQFLLAPYPASFLFLGPSGTGKTTMALAEALRAELHHVPSQEGDVGRLDSIVTRCHYIPMLGDWHLVLVDEADRISKAAQLFLLSRLDSTRFPPHTVFVFTANDTALLEDRFLSRCRTLRFDTDDLHEPALVLLRRIWKREARGKQLPNLNALLQQSQWNLRDALNTLELERLAPGSFKPLTTPAAVTSGPTIFTVGLARLSQVGLDEIVGHFKIRKLLDVRENTNGALFSRQSLESGSHPYQWIGDQLGERPSAAGFDALLDASASQSVLVMCREEPPGACHRHNRIAVPLIKHHDCVHIFQDELVTASALQRHLSDGRPYAFTNWK